MTQSISEFYGELGSRIRLRRRDAGLTQTELGEAAHLTRASVANIEAGRQKVLIHHLVALADVLNIDITTLLPSGTPTPSDVERLRRRLPTDQDAFLSAVLKRAGDGK